MRVVFVVVAPKGEGAASAWVVKQFAEQVRQLRAKRHQKRLGLIVQVDGDNVGVASRLQQLAAALDEDDAMPVGESEPIAMLVPTWSVETWALHLTGLGQPPESIKLKDGPPSAWSAGLAALDASPRELMQKAAAAWRTLEPAPPSLREARLQAARVGIELRLEVGGPAVDKGHL